MYNRLAYLMHLLLYTAGNQGCIAAKVSRGKGMGVQRYKGAREMVKNGVPLLSATSIVPFLLCMTLRLYTLVPYGCNTPWVAIHLGAFFIHLRCIATQDV